MTLRMNRLYFVRHGENWANLTREFSHKKIDYSLTPTGILQASQTARYFTHKAIHGIYSSPLKRAVETAEIIASELDLQVKIIEGLREINVGSLEDEPVTAEGWALHDKIIRAWLDGREKQGFPGGEDYTTMLSRIRKCITEIVEQRTDQGVIVVGHGGTFNTTLRHLCRGWGGTKLIPIGDHHNCSITEVAVRFGNGRLECELVNWASHAHLTLR